MVNYINKKSGKKGKAKDMDHFMRLQKLANGFLSPIVEKISEESKKVIDKVTKADTKESKKKKDEQPKEDAHKD